MVECKTSDDCALRHRMQDELNSQIHEIHAALLGTPLSKEPSIKEKVSEMYKERSDLKRWFMGSVVTIIIFIFTLGITYEKINNLTKNLSDVTNRIDKIEQRMLK